MLSAFVLGDDVGVSSTRRRVRDKAAKKKNETNETRSHDAEDVNGKTKGRKK